MRRDKSYHARETAGNFSLEQSENSLPPKKEKTDPEDQRRGGAEQKQVSG